MIRVVRGNPTPEELAATLAVMRARAAAAASATEDRPGPDSAWSDPARTVPRALPPPGPRAWQRTYWPR